MLAGVFDLPMRWTAEYHTPTARQKTVILADGSTLVLNGETALSTDFTAQMRHVDLHAGEVFFNVKSDPNRPFSIHTRSGRVDVLGTAFDLRLNRTGLVVTVLESRVRVTGQAGATAVLKPG